MRLWRLCVLQEILEFHVGFRVFKARPIFSQNNLGAEKHLYERFLEPSKAAAAFPAGGFDVLLLSLAPLDAFAVASVYGPVTYTPAPVLVFKYPHDEEDAATSRLEVLPGGGAGGAMNGAPTLRCGSVGLPPNEVKGVQHLCTAAPRTHCLVDVCRLFICSSLLKYAGLQFSSCWLSHGC